ncbi:DUF533 domain-containing protein [Pseudaestuariivita rosea]|uniref:DUF533 domain-containing protein n=1 Tax=Pseudaestuariivita rosea TaxID=2763263 RepID=UPI001ABA665E|nr:DUF533 domain-containing protein [Pseudaestuariivita rosea]
MGLTKTLFKVALGYAAARGVDRLSRGGGLQGLMQQSGMKGGLANMLRGAGDGRALPTGSTSSQRDAPAQNDLDQMFDDFNAPETEEDAAVARLMLRAVIQAAKADGVIDADEKARIMDMIGDDAMPDDISFVKEQLNEPLDPASLAKDTPVDLRRQLYAMSLTTIRVDTAAEVHYLGDLADHLMLPQDDINRIHDEMGVARLHS